MFSVLPVSSFGSFLDGPSTSTFCTLPTMASLISRALALIAACRRERRACFSSLDTVSSRSAAGVPGRREPGGNGGPAWTSAMDPRGGGWPSNGISRFSETRRSAAASSCVPTSPTSTARTRVSLAAAATATSGPMPEGQPIEMTTSEAGPRALMRADTSTLAGRSALGDFFRVLGAQDRVVRVG